MKLVYYQRTRNFGDALNPLIFERLLPQFFDEDESIVFLGIGSILHYTVPHAKRIIVFSTGFAYGSPPVLDETYSVICVRGPLTAARLGLGSKLAITDGAALLKTFCYDQQAKVHSLSFMPHHESPGYFDWRVVCEELGFHYIDPADEPEDVIQQILRSEVLVTEAMHGAIVADTLRVPWIPVRFYPGIRSFKWNDWAASLGLTYEPVIFPSLYTRDAYERRFILRSRQLAPRFVARTAAQLHQFVQNSVMRKHVLKKLEGLRSARQFLSDERILDQKVEQLVERLRVVRATYGTASTLQ